MKIRNLRVLMMTVALTILCFSAAQGQDDVTILDYTKQSLKITRFGTVVEFKTKTRLYKHNHTFKICTCGKDPQCIEPNATTEPDFEMVFPKTVRTRRTPPILNIGESLKVVATVKLGRVTVTRRLEWLAGSNVVYVAETVNGEKTDVCNIEESGIYTSDSCSMPPPSEMTGALKCPPPTWTQESLTRFPNSWKGHLVSYRVDLARVALVEPRCPKLASPGHATPARRSFHHSKL